MRTSRRYIFHLLSWTVLISLGSYFGFDIYSKTKETFRYKPEARHEVRDLLTRIHLGDSSAQVRQSYNKGRYQSLKLRVHQTNEWIVSTPYEFGANNWVLYIEYDDQDKVAALRVRTNDSVFEKPREAAPQDKISPTWRKPFPQSSFSKG